MYDPPECIKKWHFSVILLNKKRLFRRFCHLRLITIFPRTEAVAAIHRTLASGLERNTRLRSAFRTRCFKHRAVASALLFLGRTALRASLGDILEALFLVEFLLGSGKDELTPTIRTLQRFVLKHFLSFFCFHGIQDEMILSPVRLLEHYARLETFISFLTIVI